MLPVGIFEQLYRERVSAQGRPEWVQVSSGLWNELHSQNKLSDSQSQLNPAPQNLNQHPPLPGKWAWTYKGTIVIVDPSLDGNEECRFSP